MARRKHRPEQVIERLRQAEVPIPGGATVGEACRTMEVTELTGYCCRAEYGGLRIDKARRLEQLETENVPFRRAVADLTLDNQILKEAAQGNTRSLPQRAGPSRKEWLPFDAQGRVGNAGPEGRVPD